VRQPPTPPDPRADLGRRGEALACDHLAGAGLTVLARNWRCRAGEIDVVATAPGLLVFCEVKTRRGSAYGTPAAAVTPRKQARLRALAAAWLAGTDHPPGRVRFDVITVTWPRGGAPDVIHLEGAF
jgi:putative endonuclease